MVSRLNAMQVACESRARHVSKTHKPGIRTQLQSVTPLAGVRCLAVLRFAIWRARIARAKQL